MNQIKSLSLSSMNNGAHFAFHYDSLSLIEDNSFVTEKLSEQIKAYKTSITNEQNVIKLPQKSLFSDEVTKADLERDALYKGLKNAISAYRAIPNEAINQAYKVLSQLLKDYNIKPSMQTDQQTGLLIKLIDDLENKYTNEVKKLSLNNFISSLKEANERLRNTLAKRNEEKSNTQRPVGALKQARTATDENYKTLIKFINAYALIEGYENYDSTINQLNILINRYKIQVVKGRNKATTNKENPTKTEK